MEKGCFFFHRTHHETRSPARCEACLPVQWPSADLNNGVDLAATGSDQLGTQPRSDSEIKLRKDGSAMLSQGFPTPQRSIGVGELMGIRTGNHKGASCW